MRSLNPLVVVAASMILLPLSGSAQHQTPASVLVGAKADSAHVEGVGPRSAHTRVGITTWPAPAASVSAEEVESPLVQRSQRERGRTLMIVGAALLVAGLLIDDDVGTVLALGGVVVGIYGLLQWSG